MQRMLRAMGDIGSSLQRYAYSCHVAFDGALNEQWQWIAWPGKRIRQQGLAALVFVQHVFEHERRAASPQCEVAYVGLDMWASRLRESCNT